MQSQIENAAQSIKDCGAREVALLGEQVAKKEELALAEAAAGDAYLSGAGGDHVDRVIRLQVESKSITMAIAALREQRLKAVQHHHDCQIAALRERAAEAMRQAQEITAQTAPLLEQIVAIEGCSFIANGTPASARANSMARLIESQASELERHGIARHGHIEVDSQTFSLDEILQAVLQQPVDGPDARTVISWVQSQPRSATFAGQFTTCRIFWDMAAVGILPVSCLRVLPQPVAVAPVEEPVAADGNLVSPNEFFGHSPKRQKTA